MTEDESGVTGEDAGMTGEDESSEHAPMQTANEIATTPVPILFKKKFIIQTFPLIFNRSALLAEHEQSHQPWLVLP